MSSWLALGVLVACIVALAKTADVLLDGVLVFAARWRMSGALAGVTLAAVATSSPELATTVASLASGDAATSDIGIGTVIGSAMFNLAAIVGLLALRKPVPLESRLVSRDLPAYVAAVAALLIFLAVPDLGWFLGRAEGAAFLVGYVLYLGWVIRDIARADEPPVTADRTSLWGATFRVVVGLAIIGVASHYLVQSAATLARAIGAALSLPGASVSSFISVVVVAAGTSVPDAFTSLAAAKRGESSLAVSNAIGSNTFDILVCLGLPYLVLDGGTVSLSVVAATVYLFVAAGVVWMLARRRRLERRSGFTLAALYLVFVAMAATTVWAGV